MPLIPIFVILGAVGMLGWAREHTGQKWQRILGTSWLMACALVELGFWVMAAGSYATDVAIIETEMVEPALWLEANSAPGDRVAAHDIGALGYFSRRELLDLAGLVSPEVTPILGDEEKLAILLDEREIDYLILTFDWYPRLRAGKESIYCSQAGYAPALGAKNTCIYAWHP
jgi:hypothetical protein